MNKPYAGGCTCGAIRYEVVGEPVTSGDCQCRQCQRQSGTGHSSYLTFVGATVGLSGEPSHWRYVGDGGTVKSCAFCPTCGAPLYITFPDMPDVFVIRAASLDEPSRYKPDSVLWTAAAQPWDHIDPALRKFEKMPPR